MNTVVFLLVALVAIFLAWKLLAGIVKTVALAAILIIAAIVVFGVLS
ncbi:hypothetical protein [Altericroceibacterium xinjiangense]|nr:hypothetical protein [Altericroceibacterium xinjiangense]